MLRLLGAWGNRPDPLQSADERLQRSVRLAPSEPEHYGPWGIWIPREPDARTGHDLVSVNLDDRDAVEDAIRTATERVNGGPLSGAGLYIKFARRVIGDRPETSPTWFDYNVRAGFFDKKRPFNHILMQLEEGNAEPTLMRYMSALVQAWHPDHLGAVTLQAKKAQGHKPPEVAIGRLTYIRSGTTLNISALADDIDVAAADGGHYIRISGTPEQPSLDHIATVRRALGYSG